MKIVKQSAVIMPPMKSTLEQIAEAGKVCYQVDEVKGGPEAFYDRIVKAKHYSVLEMAVVTLVISFVEREAMSLFCSLRSDYFHITSLNAEKNEVCVTGSVRAWTDWANFLIKQGEHGGFVARPIIEAVRNEIFSTEDPVYQDVDFYQKIAGVENAFEVMSEAHPAHRNKHLHVMVKINTDRSTANQITRHRPCSFLQESQRYCRYSDDKFCGVSFIDPEIYFDQSSPEYAMWERHCSYSEQLYLKLLKDGSTPQAARKVLPLSTKTELIVYANLEQWQHMFKLRTDKKADPSMRELMIPLMEEFEAKGWLKEDEE